MSLKLCLTVLVCLLLVEVYNCQLVKPVIIPAIKDSINNNTCSSKSPIKRLASNSFYKKTKPFNFRNRSSTKSSMPSALGLGTATNVSPLTFQNKKGFNWNKFKPVKHNLVANVKDAEIYLSSDLKAAGDVQVGGKLPFLSAVSLEGPLPSRGKASVNYDCGNDVQILGAPDQWNGSFRL